MRFLRWQGKPQHRFCIAAAITPSAPVETAAFHTLPATINHVGSASRCTVGRFVDVTAGKGQEA